MRQHVYVIAGSVILISIAACRGQREVTIGGQGSGAVTGQQVWQLSMPERGNVRDAVSGRELWFAYGAINGVNGTKANGVATAHYLEDGTYILGMQLNIKNPEDGQFYEGWLLPDDGTPPVSVGHFVQGQRDAQQILSLRSDHDSRTRTRIAVSLEKDDGNPAQGEVVAEGGLKVTKR